ncbi:MAG: DsbA family oxidoreductase [Nostoc sp. S4]|nr:DsbA family oxidoreductase [Nostoc sp. S4]
MTLAIAITSDFICPWCLVAHIRLNRAIEQLSSPIAIQRIWYPFELNPDMPIAGMDRKTYRSQKFGSWEHSQLLDAKTIQATLADEIDFRYDLMQVTPNTLNAHRLTWLATGEGKATQMAESILAAYFTQGQNIGEIEILVNLAVEVGIDAGKAKAFLLSTQGIQSVKQLEQQASAQGIHGVPAIRIGKKILSGAQPVEVFVAALQAQINELQVV